MEKYLDPPDNDFAELHYGSTTLMAEVKKESTQHLLEVVSAKSS